MPSYPWARYCAADIALAALGSRPGTFGYAVVRRDGHVAVFEDFPLDQEDRR